MMGIQEYDCPQESVLIDTHEGYVSSDRKKTRKRKIAQFINLLLVGLGRPLVDIFCKVIPHPKPIPNRLAVLHWWRLSLESAHLFHTDNLCCCKKDNTNNSPPKKEKQYFQIYMILNIIKYRKLISLRII